MPEDIKSKLKNIKGKLSFENTALIIFIIIFIASRQLHQYHYQTYFINQIFTLGVILLPLKTFMGISLYPLSAIFSFFLPTNFYGTSVALTTIYQLGVLFFFVLYFFFLKKLKRIHNPSNIFMGILIVIFFIITIYHDQGIGMYNSRLVHFLEGALIYFTIIYFLSEKKKMRLFLYGLLFTAFTITVRFFTFGSFEYSMAGFENNAVSRVLIFIFIPAVFLFFAEKKWQPKVIALVLSGFILHSLIYLGSRGTYMAAVAMFLMIFLRNIHKPKIWAAFVVGIIFFTAIAPQMFWEEWGSIKEAQYGVESSDQSIAGRFYSAEQGLRLFKDNLFMGVGIGRFQPALNAYVGYSMNAHNAYIEMAAEQGIFGIIFYLALFVLSFWNLFRAIKNFRGKDQFFYNMSLGVQLGFVGLAVNQTFINGPWDSIVFIAFGVSTALYVISQKQIKNVTKLPEELVTPSPK